jgi:hypothetical protein
MPTTTAILSLGLAVSSSTLRPVGFTRPAAPYSTGFTSRGLFDLPVWGCELPVSKPFVYEFGRCSSTVHVDGECCG